MAPQKDANVYCSSYEQIILDFPNVDNYFKGQHPKKIEMNYKLRSGAVQLASVDVLLNQREVRVSILFPQNVKKNIRESSNLSYDIYIRGAWGTDEKKDLLDECRIQTITIPRQMPSKDAECVYFDTHELIMDFQKIKELFHPSFIPKYVELFIRIDQKLYLLGTSETGYFCTKFSKEIHDLLEKSSSKIFKVLYLGKIGSEKFSVEQIQNYARETTIRLTKTIHFENKLELCNPSLSIQTQIAKIRQKLTTNIKEPINIMIFGPSSVGKSCLINTFEHCLYSSLTQSSFGQLDIGNTGTKHLHVKFLTENIRIFDFPGYEGEKAKAKSSAMANNFWSKFTIKELALYGKFLDDGTALENIKKNETIINEIEEQIHSVIFLWKPCFEGFFI